MRNTGGVDLASIATPFSVPIDGPRVERAIGELLRFAAQVGVSGFDLIGMLNRGVSVPEILSILEEKAQGRSH